MPNYSKLSRLSAFIKYQRLANYIGVYNFLEWDRFIQCVQTSKNIAFIILFPTHNLIQAHAYTNACLHSNTNNTHA